MCVWSVIRYISDMYNTHDINDTQDISDTDDINRME